MITSLKQLAVVQDAGGTFGGAGGQNGHETDARWVAAAAANLGEWCKKRQEQDCAVAVQMSASAYTLHSSVVAIGKEVRCMRAQAPNAPTVATVVHPDGVPPRRAGRRDQVPAVNAARASGVHPPDVILISAPPGSCVGILRRLYYE